MGAFLHSNRAAPVLWCSTSACKQFFFVIETSGKHWAMVADACRFRTRLQAAPGWLYNLYLVSLLEKNTRIHYGLPEKSVAYAAAWRGVSQKALCMFASVDPATQWYRDCRRDPIGAIVPYLCYTIKQRDGRAAVAALLTLCMLARGQQQHSTWRSSCRKGFTYIPYSVSL